MGPPFFSIVTITRNSEKYLAETIESVAAQEYPHKEHIIIDGGSTDGTLAIVKSFGDSVRHVSEPDRGISDAMNKGIALAKGDIVSHLHSDDLYLPGALSRVAEIFVENPETKWVSGNGEFIDERGSSLGLVRFKAYSFDRLKSHNFLVHPSVFIKKELFDEIGCFDKGLKYAMDYDIWLRMGEKHPPFRTEDIFSSFRQHEGSLSTLEKLKALDEEYSIRKRFCKEEPFQRKIFYYMRYKVSRSLKQFNFM